MPERRTPASSKKGLKYSQTSRFSLETSNSRAVRVSVIRDIPGRKSLATALAGGKKTRGLVRPHDRLPARIDLDDSGAISGRAVVEHEDIAVLQHGRLVRPFDLSGSPAPPDPLVLHVDHRDEVPVRQRHHDVAVFPESSFVPLQGNDRIPVEQIRRLSPVSRAASRRLPAHPLRRDPTTAAELHVPRRHGLDTVFAIPFPGPGGSSPRSSRARKRSPMRRSSLADQSPLRAKTSNSEIRRRIEPSGRRIAMPSSRTTLSRPPLFTTRTLSASR